MESAIGKRDLDTSRLFDAIGVDADCYRTFGDPYLLFAQIYSHERLLVDEIMSKDAVMNGLKDLRYDRAIIMTPSKIMYFRIRHPEQHGISNSYQTASLQTDAT